MAFFACISLALSLFFSALTLAITTQPVATFENHAEVNFNWKKIANHPSNNDQFFIFTDDGKIKTIVKGKTRKEIFFDLTQAINAEGITLSSVAFHPDYILKDQPGYHRIYTAHREILNRKKRAIRIPKVTPANHQYDLVINEWVIKNNKIDKASKREIIRISSPDKNVLIQQLSFNAHLKPWQDNYGNLYITLNHSEEHKDTPLYSGAVLSIHPEKFGLRNYTIPNKNPFLENKEIADEIALVGAGNIQSIIWQKTRINEWFYITQEQGLTTLYSANIGENLLERPNEVLWQSANSSKLNNIIWYEGRSLSNLLYKFVFLNYKNDAWHINELSIENGKVVYTALEKLEQTNANAEIGLMTNHNNELLLLDRSNGVFNLLLKLGNEKVTTKNIEKKEESSINILLIVFGVVALIVIIGAVYYLQSFKLYHDKSFLNKYFARFELKDNKTHIALFKRHKEEAHVILPIKNFTLSEVFLNNEKVSEISSTTAFDEKAQKDLLMKFSLEQRHKMIDHRLRSITLKLTDKKKKKQTVCLYFRRGNQRYTRIHFQDSIKIITDWCWAFQHQINQNDT